MSSTSIVSSIKQSYPQGYPQANLLNLLKNEQKQQKNPTATLDNDNTTLNSRNTPHFYYLKGNDQKLCLTLCMESFYTLAK